MDLFLAELFYFYIFIYKLYFLFGGAGASLLCRLFFRLVARGGGYPVLRTLNLWDPLWQELWADSVVVLAVGFLHSFPSSYFALLC